MSMTPAPARPLSSAPPVALATALMIAACSAGCRSSTPPASPTIVANTPAAPAPAGELVLRSESWTIESPQGRILYTPGYKIYTTSTKPFITDHLPAFLETALAHYTTTLTDLPSSPEPLEVFLLDTRLQWERITQRFMGEDAEIYLRIQKGGFTSNGRAILYDIGRRDTFAITAHEGWHVYTQRTFRNALPVWLEEGLACYMEGFRWDPSTDERPRFLPWANFERFDQLRRGARLEKLMPLEKLVGSTPQQLIADDADAALTYYAQVWALVHFLNEGAGGAYRPALRQIVSDAASGRLVNRISRELGQRAANAYVYRKHVPDILSVYFGKSAAAMQGEFDAFVEQVVRTGSRQQLWQGKSPLAP